MMATNARAGRTLKHVGQREGRWRWTSALAIGALLGCQPSFPRPPAPPEPGASRAPTAPVHFVGRAGSGVSGSESGLEDRLGSIKARLEALSANTMTFWKANGLDAKYGGVHGFHDRRGVPKEDAPKGLVQQTRHLWSFSTWYARREKTPEIKAAADSIYSFLGEHFLDHEDGEFFYTVSRDGTQAVDPKKQLYAESFAIFALATYAQVFGWTTPARRRWRASSRSIVAPTTASTSATTRRTTPAGWLPVLRKTRTLTSTCSRRSPRSIVRAKTRR